MSQACAGQKIDEMNGSLRFSKSVLPLLTYILVLPGFFIMSAYVYNPFDILEYYTFGTHSLGFHLLMLTCILLIVLTVTRVPLYFVMRNRPVSRVHYLLLCAGEIFAAACFMALYTELFKRNPDGWFQSLGFCLKITFLVLCYPSLFFYMFQLIQNKNEDIAIANSPREDDTRVKFHDEHKRLKLTIAPSSLLFVESKANYVMINYLDSTKVKQFLLRCSMKSIEESVSAHGLVRCHRSFFVNPAHVSVLRKGTDGLTYAELDSAGLPPVPVSKQYYESLSSKL